MVDSTNPIGYAPSAPCINLPPTPYAELPPKEKAPGSLWYCPDAPGGDALVFISSDGPRLMARGMQSAVKVTNASGAISWTFPAGTFDVAPVVNATVLNGTGQPVVVELVSVTKDAVSLRVKRAQLLPALLASLFGFDVFGVTALGGISVHIRASLPT